MTVIDGAQAVPQLPLDLREIDADFYAWTGHKALGPTSACCTDGASCSRHAPFLGGGHMISRVEREHSTWNELPFKFEAGTSAATEAVGLGAAVDTSTRSAWSSVRAHERDLTAYVHEHAAGPEGGGACGELALVDRTGACRSAPRRAPCAPPSPARVA